MNSCFSNFQGVLNVVMHVVDRKPHSKGKQQQCEKMCTTMTANKTNSKSYRNTLIRTLDKVCAPADEYVACLYHTMKFDVLDPLN